MISIISGVGVLLLLGGYANERKSFEKKYKNKLEEI